MSEFAEQVAGAAENVVAMAKSRGLTVPDYTEASLAVVEDMLAEATDWVAELTSDQLTMLVQDFGCYTLEVGRRAFGGRYLWHDGRNQPVLVVGEPAYRVAILTWDKVRGRLSGDAGDNIPFFFAGFAERARRAEPDDDVLYV